MYDCNVGLQRHVPICSACQNNELWLYNFPRRFIWWACRSCLFCVSEILCLARLKRPGALFRFTLQSGSV